jgi:hypothetical protein
LNTGRRLSTQAKQRLSDLLSKFAGTDGSDIICAMMGDGESITLARDFVEAFKAAGWIMNGTGFSQGMYPGAPQGIYLQFPSKTDVAEPGKFIAAFLDSLAYRDMYLQENAKLKPGKFRLVIGHA